jgi:hypothetical protein
VDLKALHEIERLLSKEVIKENLAKAGLYVIAYEMVKNSIVERPKGFSTMSGEGDGCYREIVLSKHGNPFIASCRWFQDEGAITEQDIAELLEFREVRNRIVHELPNVLLEPQLQVDASKLAKLYTLLCKIDQWWITHFEIPCNEDFDGEDVDELEIQSGSIQFLAHVIRVVYDLDRAATPGPKPN